jgi:protein-S-isoprenylcysteine O-methyltransferase Ste14
MIERLLGLVRTTMVEKKKPFYQAMIPAIIVLSVASVLIDVFLPHIALWNYTRAFVALVLSVPIFSLGYLIGLRQSDANKRKAEESDDEADEYVEWRLRYSPNKRIQQSLMVGGVLAAVVIVSSFSALYTVCAGFVLAGIYAIVAYCRLTDDEKDLKEKGLDDPRDVFEQQIKKDNELTQAALVEIRKEELLKEQEAREKEEESDADDAS